MENDDTGSTKATVLESSFSIGGVGGRALLILREAADEN
jgi:hypothetical protein